MASQHFYSRVPARVSMYNKFDSFDTFAHSKNLSREFIERELSIVYQDKLSKNDMPLVRRGEINPVYYQCFLKSGKLVQGCISYLPLDYTGERSAYFTHSLVFSEEEKNSLLEDANKMMFNSDLFKTDISEFDITSPTATPNNNYEELEYFTKPISEVQGIYKKYDPETIKSFIGAILLSLCKKGKNVYFTLDVEDENLSIASLNFINEILSIFPYSLKQNLSYITYLNDFTQYPSFKLKCVSSKCPEIYQEKGVFFDFKINLITGLDLEEIRINKNEINFLYSLLENNEMRIEFLKFVTNAIRNIPSLQNLNLKTLSDLIFLFCGSCGFFRETAIIPDDDSVYNFFCVYEKYRSVLNEEYRMRAYKVLKRYPENHLGIPKTIFQKLTKLYPLDIQSAKRMAMDIVLELIHTDIMREKLFAFISSNYTEEDEETKKTINNDLCRVFYGGFMQPQILKFFTTNFASEPIETQDQVLEKLFLTIRTISIQPKIIEFIELHYDIFTLEQKYKFYETFFEMLPECDELTKSLVKIVDKHAINEDKQLLEYIYTNFEKKLEADYRKKENLLLPIIIDDRGLCLDEAIKLTFNEWSQRKIFSHFIELLTTKDAVTKINIILDILKLVPNMDEDLEQKLLQNLQNIFKNNYNNTNLYIWIDLYNLLLQKTNNKIIDYIKNEEITNGIIARINDCFDTKLNPQGLEIIKEFAKENTKVKESFNYQFVSNYIEMIGNVQINEITKAFDIYDAIPSNKQLRQSMANHINTHVIDRKKQSPLETIYFDIMVYHLKDGTIPFDKLYNQYKDLYKRQFFTKYGANANPKKAIEEAVSNSLRLIFDSCYNISKTSASLSEVICSSNSKLKTGIQDLVITYGSKTKKWIHGVTEQREQTKFVIYFNQLLKESKPQSGKLFKIFSKK